MYSAVRPIDVLMVRDDYVTYEWFFVIVQVEQSRLGDWGFLIQGACGQRESRRSNDPHEANSWSVQLIDILGSLQYMQTLQSADQARANEHLPISCPLLFEPLHVRRRPSPNLCLFFQELVTPVHILGQKRNHRLSIIVYDPL